MGLTVEEAIDLSDEAIELGQAIGAALKADSPGGKRITQKERARIGRAALRLAWMLLRDLAD